MERRLAKIQSLFYVLDSVMEVAVLLSEVYVTMYEITIPSTYPFKVLSETIFSYIAIIFVLQLISNIRKIPKRRELIIIFD